MQQSIFLESTDTPRKDIGAGLILEVLENSSRVNLYKQGIPIKSVDLSDRTAKRLFVVETVELGATRYKLAEALGISRQSIHNYIEIKSNFGAEGLINSYQPDNSKSRAKQRKDHQQKIHKGNKARQLEEMRRKEIEKPPSIEQQSLPSERDAQDIQTVASNELPFSESHGWQETRYAGVFVYFICLIFQSRWFEQICGHFGDAYKIFMVFVLMAGRHIPSIEQLKNVRSGEAGTLLGLGKLPCKTGIWEWFYHAANKKKSDVLLRDYFCRQINTGIVATWMWFVDGHLLPYTGKTKVHYSYSTQRRMPMPGQTNMLTCDSGGRIVDFDIQEGKGDYRRYIKSLKKYRKLLSFMPMIIFDREGYGAEFFNELIKADIPFATWDKYVDTAKLATIEDARFSQELSFNGKEYALFEDEKAFTFTPQGEDNPEKQTFKLRHLYIWNKTSNRRTCGLAWTGDTAYSTIDCAQAILSRWGASENTFKHIKDRHPFHYHPGFRLIKSESQEIANPEIKEKQGIIKSLTNRVNRLYKKCFQTKEATNKDGSVRKNRAREKNQEEIKALEAQIKEYRKEKKNLADKIDVSGLESYRTFKQIDNEGKNLFDFVTSSLWNARKQMVDWLEESFEQKNEVVDLFYAITQCHGWIKTTRTEVIARIEPLQQPRYRAAQVQLCRKLSTLGARLPSGKLLLIEVGDKPAGVSKK